MGPKVTVRLLMSILAVLIFGELVIHAQDVGDYDLAKWLADEETESSAVDHIVALANQKTPLLLSWTRTPPAGVDRRALNVGLADAFGALRTRDAIPFLVENINLHRWRVIFPDVWMKTEEVIERHYPAAKALIRIGRDASKEVITNWDPADSRKRLISIFVVARIHDPSALTFLLSVRGDAKDGIERYWAEQGLRFMGAP